MNSPEAIPTPKSPVISPAAQQLGWVIQRMAATQGRSPDRLQLHEALLRYKEEHSWTESLQAVLQHLGWPELQALPGLDEARLPLVVHHPEWGWGVAMGRSAEGHWLCDTPTGRQQLDPELGQSQSCARVQMPPPNTTLRRAQTMIWDSFLQYKGILIEGAGATLLINLLALAISFFSMQVYDRVIPSQGFNTLWLLSLGVFMAIAFELVLKLVRSHVMEHAVVGLDASLSRDIFQRLLNVRLDQMPHSVGSLAGQLRAYEGIRALLTASTAYLLVDVPFALFFVIVIGMLATPLLLTVPLVFLLGSLATGLSLRKRIQKAAGQGAAAGNLKTGLLVEAVEGAETIKAGQGGWRFLSRWIDVNTQAISYDLQIRHLSELGGYLTGAFQQLSYAGLVAVGAWQVVEGHMTMGALIGCSILSGRAMAPVGMIPGLLVQYAHAKAALDGLEKIYALEADNAGIERPLLPSQLHGHYRLENVRYDYRAASGAVLAITVPQLEIQAGEKIGVLGPVGSGKSTLLRLLSGLYQPREGRILLNSLELSHISRQRLSEQIGYLQQDHRLFSGSLRENLLIGLPDPGDDAIYTAAKATGLLSLIADHPKGLELSIAEGGKGLSGGQKQLVALTRLLLTQPRIWLLDEPTASMDDELERRCIQVLHQNFQADHTALIVTHKPSMLPLVNRIIVVAQHRIVLDGPRDEVLQRLRANAAPQPGSAPAAGP